MESFFSRYKNGLVLLAVLLAQLIGLALQVRRPVPNSPDSKPVRLLRYWVISAFAPPARLSHGAGRGARSFWSDYIDMRSVRQQNQALQAEVDRLRLEEGAIAEDARQGQRLQHLLDFKEHYIYQTVTAQVIGTAGSDRARLLIVDKGSQDGIALEMPVITPDGIVGKVREVFPYSAQVLEISDQASGAGVMLETTRIRGVLRGNAYGQPQIINILPDDRIKPGEHVLTSGGDQIYPRGLPVGVVERVANDPERNPYIDVIVKPGADLSRLEEVLIITSAGDQLPQGAVTDLAKSEAEARQHSAAEVLSEKLPSIRDPNDPNAATPGSTPPGAGAQGPALAAGTDAAKKAAAAAVTARALKAQPPLHPDRFTTGVSSSAPAPARPADGAPARADGTVAPKQKATPRAPAAASIGSEKVNGAPPPRVLGGTKTNPSAVSQRGLPGTSKTTASKTVATKTGATKAAGSKTPGSRTAATKTGAPKAVTSKAATQKSPSAVESAPPSVATQPAPAEMPPQPAQNEATPSSSAAKYVEPYAVKPEPAAVPQQSRPGGTKLNPITRLTRKLFKGKPKPATTEQQAPAPSPAPQKGP